MISRFLSKASVQSLSRVRLLATPWTATRQASLPITNSSSSLKLMSIESVMPSNHPILCHPLLLPPSIFPRIRVFSKESVFCIRWSKYWRFSISPSNEYSGLISFRMDWLDQPVQSLHDLGRLDRSLIVTLSHHFPLSNPTSGHREYLQFLKCMCNNSFHIIHLFPSNHASEKFKISLARKGFLLFISFFYSIYHTMFNCLVFLLLDHSLREDRDQASLPHN